MPLQAIIAVFLWWAAIAPGAAGPRRAEDVFILSAARASNGEILLSWAIAQGYYLYRDKLAASAEEKALPLVTSAGEIKNDPNFGPTEIYQVEARATLAGNSLPPDGSIRVSFQGCAKQGVCYPPVTDSVDLRTLSVARQPRPALDPAEAALAAPAIGDAKVRPAAIDGLFAQLSGSFLFVFVSFLGFGVLMAMTPCVFPMIPILSGMLARSGERLTPRRAFVLSGVYAIAIGVAYGTLGVAAAWSGQNLQILLQTPIALRIAAIVFVALALSMFGLFDLSAPMMLATRFAGSPGSRAGSVAGAALLGFGSALVVGPCVTPPLAAALLYVAQTGDLPKGAVALFAMGFGVGLPLMIFGVLGGSLLPKSGRWLVAVKQLFGFGFLVLATLMVARTLPPTYGLGLWGGASVVLAATLISSRGSLAPFARPVGALGLVYGTILLVGFVAGASDPLNPLAMFMAPSSAGDVPVQRVVTSATAFDQALADARSANRPVLVDFTADWCATCGEIDRTVLSDSNVRARMRSIFVIKVDLTKQPMDEKLQGLLRQFGVVGPPALLMLNANTGSEFDGARTVGPISIEDFSRLLSLAGA